MYGGGEGLNFFSYFFFFSLSLLCYLCPLVFYYLYFFRPMLRLKTSYLLLWHMHSKVWELPGQRQAVTTRPKTASDVFGFSSWVTSWRWPGCSSPLCLAVTRCVIAWASLLLLLSPLPGCVLPQRLSVWSASLGTAQWKVLQKYRAVMVLA